MVVRFPGTNNEPNADYYGGENSADYSPDRPQRDYYRSSAREYAAAGEYDRQGRDRSAYGARDYGNDRYAQREQMNRGYGQGSYVQGQYGQGGRGGYGQSQRGYGRDEQAYHGSYAHDGHRFEDVGRARHADDDYRYDPDRQQRYGQPRGQDQQRGYGRQPQGYDYDDRGFFARAGDEVRSWFGDDEAERRRDLDARYDERTYAARSQNDRDDDYHSWRRQQIDALDRDYDEYRQENRTKFHNEFGSWRSQREGQRSSLSKVNEHMDVVGSDGGHVGTVDKVRGDRILLTKNDPDAGGQHHSIPSRWIESVDTKVTLAKTADEAKAHWRDEDRNQAMFNYGDNARGSSDDQRGTTTARDSQGRVLGKTNPTY